MLIAKQAVLKSLLESQIVPAENTQAWLKSMFDFCMGLLTGPTAVVSGNHKPLAKPKVEGETVSFVPSEVSELKTKAKGTPFYKVFDPKGVAYATFNKDYAAMAGDASENNNAVQITYTTSQYGRRIEHLEMYGD